MDGVKVALGIRGIVGGGCTIMRIRSERVESPSAYVTE